MARAGEKDGVLRGCPTCGTRVEDTALGLRDFRWVNEELPGRVGLMDLDGALTHSQTGRVLLLELKPKGARISRGAQLTFETLISKGDVDIWVVWDHGGGKVAFSELDKTGRARQVRYLTQKRVAVLVRQWWEAGLEQGRNSG